MYSAASDQMARKLRKALAGYDAERIAREKALDSTREAMEAHKEWLRAQAARTGWLASMADQLAERAVNANEAAAEAAANAVPRVYAHNANFAAYEVDMGVRMNTMFHLVDESTVRNLMEQPNSPLVREVKVPKVDRPRDYRWNRRRFNAAMTQGILQGESIDAIVKRTRSIFGGNMSAAYRAARTAMTSAQNAGRVSSYTRARELGIKVQQKWVATKDGLTRDAHMALDGQVVEAGGVFDSELGPIAFPGDPSADPANTYNCRCTLEPVTDGEEARGDYEDLPADMTYDEWVEMVREQWG